jgi:hypothetical protein
MVPTDEWNSLQPHASQMSFRVLSIWWYQEAAMAYFSRPVNYKGLHGAAITALELGRRAQRHRELAIEALVAVGKH